MGVIWTCFNRLHSRAKIYELLTSLSYSKLCPKCKIEKPIQEIKTNKNISYPEAHKLIVPQLSQTYIQAAKSSTVNNSTQTDENITIKCPPLKLLEPLPSISKPNISTSTPVSTSSSTQAQLVPSTSSTAATLSKPQQLYLVACFLPPVICSHVLKFNQPGLLPLTTPVFNLLLPLQ
ncbi:uncharacterized protein TNCV_3652851 [Trichonephila clavipes]|nr:uncharacterized protein TNCV_3652851 [Trichonephila clavipes]